MSKSKIAKLYKNPIINNAYRILGLEITSSQKEINRRGKEMLKFLKIDEMPNYSFDLSFNYLNREQASIEEALQNLTDVNKRIPNFFFWFQNNDEIDEKSLDFIKEQKYKEAIENWQEQSTENNSRSLFYKKNMAILLSLLSFNEYDINYTKNSIILWQELIQSEGFWTAFYKVYRLYDEFGISQDVLLNFKSNITEYMTEIYADLSNASNDGRHFAEFSKKFNLASVDIKLAEPVYNKINNSINVLNSMKISEDGVFDDNEASQLKNELQRLQEEFNKLIDIGLFNDSRTIVIRDKVANVIRDIVLDLHNNLDELETSIKLINVAVEFCGTESLKNKLESEYKQIKENLNQRFVEDIDFGTLGPAYDKINNSIKILDEMRISEDGVFDDNELKTLKTHIKIIQDELNKLIDLGLGDDNQTLIARERTANVVRKIGLDLHNNLDELDVAFKLSDIALNFCVTEDQKAKIIKDMHQIKNNMEHEKDNYLTIELPGRRSVSFYQNRVEYGKTKLLYKDITKIAYYAVKKSTNGIPTSQDYTVMFGSNSQSINFSFSTGLFNSGKKETDSAYAKLLGISSNLIEPIIVEKLVKKVFDQKEILNIGGVEFSNIGYSRNKFWGGKEIVYWDDKVYIPSINAGYIYLFKDVKGKCKQFKDIHMLTENAVVMPEFVTQCARRYLNEQK